MKLRLALLLLFADSGDLVLVILFFVMRLLWVLVFAGCYFLVVAVAGWWNHFYFFYLFIYFFFVLCTFLQHLLQSLLLPGLHGSHVHRYISRNCALATVTCQADSVIPSSPRQLRVSFHLLPLQRSIISAWTIRRHAARNCMVLRRSSTTRRLVGLVVKASASRAEDPGFESR